MLPNRNCCCSRHTKTFAQKYLYAFPKAHTAWLPRQDFSLLHLRYVVINVFRELKLSCLFVRSWRLVEGVMRVLKLNWKCLWPCFAAGAECCWGPGVLSITTVNTAQFTWSSLLEEPGGVCICADKGEGHFGSQQRWQGGRSLRSWRAHLSEKLIMTAGIVWAFLQAQSFLCCATLVTASLSLCVPGTVLDTHWSRGWRQL